MDLWGGSLASAALLLPCDAVTRMRGISGLGWAIWVLCAIRSHLTVVSGSVAAGLQVVC